MKWYYRKHGIHVNVRVFTNGANNGTLVFRDYEFALIKHHEEHRPDDPVRGAPFITFIEDNGPE